ncbi:Dps family protein [Kineococcus sp. SYSU DK003]|uniref:Dps family protein n=1 Tax=Kineococcus sp. SYSU DK003 TaxID=3383124 RepID=UPI003D7E2588
MAKESKKMKAEGTPSYTIPGLTPEQAAQIGTMLQDRLNALTDLHLTLKHIHWNVVGPHFIAVHEMLDPQVDAVREMSDTTAERIATLGLSPVGTPGALVADRAWDDYSIGRAGAIEHLGALDLVYAGVIADHRKAIDATEELDPVTQDMLIAQSAQLEQYHWFVRAHLETAGGQLVNAGAETEVEATRQTGRAGVKRRSA